MPSVSKAVSRGGGSGGSPQTEQPTHYTYLKEFRTEQCPLFLQHKCTQHRPFTCFHWHFLNQRRRRPIRRRDGTFNYSPDVYCTKYDETTGICPDGDDCPYLHRTTGDTERKYHLRYYKTGTCIHETDARGHCVKNGVHCAFAHGPHDLRPPVYDIRYINLQSAMTCAKQVTAHVVHFVHLHMLKISCSSSPTVTSSSGSSSSLSPLGPLCRQRSLANGVLCSESSTSGVSSPTSSYPKAPGFEREDQAKHRSFPAENQQKINEQDNKQNHLSVFSAVNPLASSITSSLASSLGSDTSSPTTVSAMSAKAPPFYSGSNTVESVIGSALDLHFNDVNVASIERELEDQEGSELGLASQRLLGGSAPVNIPGSLVRSSSLHSSSSLSTSPLSSLSQSLSQSFVSSTTAPHHQQPQPLKTEHSMLGTSASSHNSLGLNGVTGSIWDFVTGSFSPSPSPVLSSGTTPSISSNTSGNELTRVRQELDDAKTKLKQWEESWQQVKQACDAWQKEAQEAKERANIADADKQLALQKKEEVENKLKKLKAQLAACLSTTLPYTKNYGDIEKISLPKLRSLQNRLHLDLETIDEVIFQLQSKKCIVCQEGDRSIILNPCQHYVLCDHCAAAQEECPCCKKKKNLW
ncbi:putative E3 ubiquitin-protein ligase UNKL isoform X11 [Aquila chrysaetos chrysaetos]|uniref:putative E3 ubiquitin-protein ligase UNKL isoform X11 n=1 Tax=Aquila chrysaetos chrysaetos TaxID=223781 RepID=UPI0005D062F0|nr:putative E3 ubiquitin-protein ligase UNKL isoform X11 [Aquila chrysaetos chrysaetos]